LGQTANVLLKQHDVVLLGVQNMLQKKHIDLQMGCLQHANNQQVQSCHEPVRKVKGLLDLSLLGLINRLLMVQVRPLIYV
jgi:hypothetical protein